VTNELDQLDHRYLESLRRRMGAPVDTLSLLTGAQRRSRRARVRSYAMRGLGGAVALAVMLAGGMGVVRALRDDHPGLIVGGSDPTAATLHAPLPPIANGASTAASAIGTDPSLLHFTVPDLVTDSEVTTWTSVDGLESVEFRKDDRGAEVSIARSESALDGLRDWHTSSNGDPYIPGTPMVTSPSPAPDLHRSVKVGDVTGTLYSWSHPPESAGNWPYLRWQPAPGVWAQIFGSFVDFNDAQPVVDIATTLRLDTVYRCAVPFELTSTPTGARLRSCHLSLFDRGTGQGFSSVLTIGTATAILRIESGPKRAEPGEAPTTTIDGHPAWVDNFHGTRLRIPTFGELSLEITGSGDYAGLPTVKGIAESVHVATDIDDLSTWPARTIG
jgi:hypothetical protein